ncbi:MAG: TIGR02680 family protein, partial [Pseudomonadota bacterium]|nr:TIGR02680 family protein [Pseudomonadota bacterium]
AAQYRRAVDEGLFRLGARYEALVNLLIQLRQPQLSKRPDERALSAALTEALPPLDQAVLNDVAEAFRNLEAEHDELESLLDARRAVGEFLLHYRRYAAIAARRRAGEVRHAQSAWDRSSGELNQVRTELGNAVEIRDAEQNRRDFLELKVKQSRTRYDTLRQSPEMRDAQRLRESEERAMDKERRAQELRTEEQRLTEEAGRREHRLDTRRQSASAAAEDIRRQARDWEPTAAAAGIQRDHGRLLAVLELPDGGERPVNGSDPRIAEATRQAEDLVERRERAVGLLQSLIERLVAAEGEEARARERRQAALDEGERLEEARMAAEEDAETRADALVKTFEQFLEAARELAVTDTQELLAELADWTRTLDGDNPLRLALHDAYAAARDRIATNRARIEEQRRAAQDELEALMAERRRLEAGEHAQPPAPYTRSPDARTDRPGAPLWQLVDFRDSCDEQTRPSLEAALEASGLLDAWVLPGGRLLDGATWDTLLVPGDSAPEGLDAVLRPAVDPEDSRAAQIDASLIGRVLACIGWGECDHPAWVDKAGNWRLGPARGTWNKPDAEYVGRGAREAARRRRLAELAELVSEVEHRLEDLNGKLGELKRRRDALEREWQTVPDDQPLRLVHQQLAELIRRRRDHQVKIEQAEASLRQAREQTEARRLERDRAAADLDLPPGAEALGEVAAALQTYTRTSAGFWPRLRHYWDNLADLHEALVELKMLKERLKEQGLHREQAISEAREAREISHTLKETLGARVEELERRLAEADAEIRDFEGRRKANEKALVDATASVSRLQERVANLEQILQDRDRDRRQAVDRFQIFVAEGLLRIATPEVEPLKREGPWPLDPSVRLARQVDQALQEIDDGDDAWRRQQRGLQDHFQALQQTLSRYGHEAGAEQSGELFLVRVVFQARPCAPDELGQNLDVEIAERRALLDAKERALLEEHLVSDVAGQLQRLIGEGERMVHAINRELEQRPTSTGMKLRLAWVPLDEESGEAPVGLTQARRRLLRQTTAAWSAADRQAVGDFLQQQIKAVREGDTAGTLLEHLERALDYRRWHRFTVERWQHGRWRPAYGPASGGERALVVTLPLFAAASSHYQSAGPHAPRLVMLDEAFAGIDDDARAKCLGLMSQFDLDFMLTSEREWGCYAQVPGLAIAQLVRREGIDAVFVSRWAWDGKRRTKAERPLIEPTPPDTAGAEPTDTEPLGPQQPLL